ncbi:nucleoside hydrolase [Alicyclobacillus contaminans]|nr:nucleoside hydrolase [Tetragenococcus osmophilus]GMA53528.1 nucleoside hydrolase [Alicyclobacillus contaminans]GMA72529.1 nucleoside hydrolase [Tetragenococcus osmophilus]
MKALLDTDIGGDIDDALCLAYLLNEPKCELLGVSTVCGNSEERASIADAICKSAGKDIDIVAGFDTTLQPIPIYPTPDGAAALKRWSHDDFIKQDPVAFLYNKIQDNPHEVVLLGIGNMTNIAMLFQQHPEVQSLLKGVYLMNGYFGSEKLPDPTWNWNSWADPLASKITFEAIISDFRVFPLEVTEQLTIPATKAKEIFKEDNKLINAVLDFGGPWLESSEQLTLHDPLVAVALFHPEICSYEKGTVTVETEVEATMGETAFSLDNLGNVKVAKTVDKKEFYQILFSHLHGESFRES